MRHHLESRGIQFEKNLYNLSYDEEKASFPLYTVNGFNVGYQQYRPYASKERKNDSEEGRYYTYVTKGYSYFFGTESMKFKSKYIFLTEGVFKTVKLHRFNLAALGVLGNDPKHVQQQINLLNRPLVALCDPDVAGSKLAKFGFMHFKVEPIPLDDMNDKQIFEFLTQRNLL